MALGSSRNWKSKQRCGRPAVTVEIRQLIRQMSGANPLWGALRVSLCEWRAIRRYLQSHSVLRSDTASTQIRS
jgi:hypothetical protein